MQTNAYNRQITAVSSVASMSRLRDGIGKDWVKPYLLPLSIVIDWGDGGGWLPDW